MLFQDTDYNSLCYTTYTCCLSIWYMKVKVSIAHLVPTLCNPMHCSPPSSSVHGILQARMLKWVAIPFSRGSSQPRDWTQAFCTVGRFFTIWATREAHVIHSYLYFLNPCPYYALSPSLALLVTISLLSISVSLFLLCFIHSFVLFFRFYV